MSQVSSTGSGDRRNATVGWSFVAVVLFVAVERALVDAYLRAAFAFVFAVLAAIPAFRTRDWTVVVPWPLLFVGAFAVLLQSFGVYPEIVGYVAIAVLGLIVVVELDVFTSVEMSRRFAIVFAVLTTMAVQGLWTIAQFYSDWWFDTRFLHSQTELQWDFVFVTVVGILIGGCFEWYFKRSDRDGSRSQPTLSDG